MAVPRRSTAGPSTASTYTSFADVAELERYKLVSNIGKGSFGVISKVQRVDDGKEFALKELDYSKMTDKDRKQILAEVAILDSLKHRNIVQLIQKIKDPKNEKIYILMEYCTSGDLGSLIRKAQRSGQPIHEDKIWNIFLQITQALHHCHWPNERPVAGQRPAGGRASGVTAANDSAPRYQVLHRDLKPENVFLSDDFVKLGDFGLSKDMGTSAFTSTYVGTPLYMPPEILGENRYDTKSDIWSLGCLVFEMCALASPFSTAQTQAELISMVKSGRLPTLPPQYSPGLKNVIKAMLNLNPVRRPTTKDLLEMDEMKLHRKLFTVQNQASLLMTKKDEIRQLEERLNARLAALEEKEKSVSAREASVEARESSCAVKEEENRETQRRLNAAAEQLRGHWEKLRGEKENQTSLVGLGLPGVNEDALVAAPRRPSTAPLRPPLEERNTVPLPVLSRFRSQHPTYEDTPSKIPYTTNIPSSPVPFDRFGEGQGKAPAATPLRRNATKSLGNIGAAYREQARAYPVDATPAKQTIPFPGKHRTSIGSPSELQRGFSEDVTMASPAYSAFGSPFVPRPRRSSVAPSVILSHQSGSMPTASSAESVGSVGSEGSPPSSDKENYTPVTVPPTMIPAPTNTFIYREAATPAKWTMDDADLPSPFLRRAPTAPAQMQTQHTSTATIPERPPLGISNAQPSVSAPTVPTTSTINGLGMGGAGVGGKPKAIIPRSRSGTLHQHVLRANAAQQAARTSGEGPKVRVNTVSRDTTRMLA